MDLAVSGVHDHAPMSERSAPDQRESNRSERASGSDVDVSRRLLAGLLARDRELRRQIATLQAESARVVEDLRCEGRGGTDRRSLGGKELEVLHLLLDAWPDQMKVAEIAAALGHSAKETAKNLQELRRRGLIESIRTATASYRVLMLPADPVPKRAKTTRAKAVTPCS